MSPEQDLRVATPWELPQPSQLLDSSLVDGFFDQVILKGMYFWTSRTHYEYLDLVSHVDNRPIFFVVENLDPSAEVDFLAKAHTQALAVLEYK